MLLKPLNRQVITPTPTLGQPRKTVTMESSILISYQDINPLSMSELRSPNQSANASNQLLRGPFSGINSAQKHGQRLSTEASR